MTVQVDGVCEVDGAYVLDDEDGPLGGGGGRGTPDGDDVVGGGKDGFVVEYVHYGGVFPVEDEGGGVDGPVEDGAGGEVEVFEDEVGRGDVGHVEGEIGDGGGEGLVEAVRGGGDGGGCGGEGGGGGVVADDAGDRVDIGVRRVAVDPAAVEPVFREGGGR